MQIVWTTPAQKRFRELSEFYSNCISIRYAAQVRKEIMEKVDLLAKFPRMGQVEISIRITGKKYRYLVVRHVKVVYRLTVNMVFIVEIFDTRQDPKKMQVK